MTSSLNTWLAASALALALPLPLPSIAAGDQKMAAAAAPATAADMADGEVRKVDVANGKLTLRHGEIRNLDMPGMTMVFAVEDKAMLGKLKVGDKVKFKATNDNGKFTVVEIAPAN